MEKTSCPLNESCQHINLVYSCKASTLYYFALIEYAFKDTLSSTSQREIQQKFLILNGVKRKRRLIWILIGASHIRQNYSPAFKNCMLCLAEKYHIIFSTKNLLNKRNELATKCRLENRFYLANYKEIPPNCLFKTFLQKPLFFQ